MVSIVTSNDNWRSGAFGGHTTTGQFIRITKPFDVHYCHMGTAMKHPVPDRVKPSFVIFDIRAL